MTKLVWDQTGKRYWETGVSNGVLYKKKMTGEVGSQTAKWVGVAWNGLISVTESPSGAELTDLWADNIKYASIRSAETFGATIEAYTYPDEFSECDGSKEAEDGVYLGQQERTAFCFCYKTKIGNDTQDESDDAYKLHIIYNATASPSEKQYNTVNDSPEANTFSWELSTTPINVSGHKPVSSIVIDSRKANTEKLAALEAKLYGSDSAEPELPDPDEIITMMSAS